MDNNVTRSREVALTDVGWLTCSLDRQPSRLFFFIWTQTLKLSSVWAQVHATQTQVQNSDVPYSKFAVNATCQFWFL